MDGGSEQLQGGSRGRGATRAGHLPHAWAGLPAALIACYRRKHETVRFEYGLDNTVAGCGVSGIAGLGESHLRGCGLAGGGPWVMHGCHMRQWCLRVWTCVPVRVAHLRKACGVASVPSSVHDQAIAIPVCETLSVPRAVPLAPSRSVAVLHRGCER